MKTEFNSSLVAPDPMIRCLCESWDLEKQDQSSREIKAKDSPVLGTELVKVRVKELRAKFLMK